MSIINRIGSVIVLAVLAGAAWIFYAGITGGDKVVAVRDEAVVNPAGPAGAIPVGSVTVGPAGTVVYENTITTPFTAPFSASLIAVARLKIANEGAARVNIERLIQELYALPGAPVARAGS